jgi:hypothetical protein
MRPNIADIIVNELQAEYDDIHSYRLAVASGIEDYDHPVLDDSALTDAMQRVIEYYKTKIDHTIPYTDSPNDVYVDTEIGDIQLDLDFDSDDAYHNALHTDYDTKFTPGGERD